MQCALTSSVQLNWFTYFINFHLPINLCRCDTYSLLVVCTVVYFIIVTSFTIIFLVHVLWTSNKHLQSQLRVNSQKRACTWRVGNWKNHAQRAWKLSCAVWRAKWTPLTSVEWWHFSSICTQLNSRNLTACLLYKYLGCIVKQASWRCSVTGGLLFWLELSVCQYKLAQVMQRQF